MYSILAKFYYFILDVKLRCHPYVYGVIFIAYITLPQLVLLKYILIPARESDSVLKILAFPTTSLFQLSLIGCVWWMRSKRRTKRRNEKFRAKHAEDKAIKKNPYP